MQGGQLECQPHGSRKTTGRRLAEAGATAKIMSVPGHTRCDEAERYTEADQVSLAVDALARLEERKATHFPQTRVAGLRKPSKTKITGG
jgi:hypothetical protein